MIAVASSVELLCSGTICIYKARMHSSTYVQYIHSLLLLEGEMYKKEVVIKTVVTCNKTDIMTGID